MEKEIKADESSNFMKNKEEPKHKILNSFTFPYFLWPSCVQPCQTAVLWKPFFSFSENNMICNKTKFLGSLGQFTQVGDWVGVSRFKLKSQL